MRTIADFKSKLLSIRGEVDRALEELDQVQTAAVPESLYLSPSAYARRHNLAAETVRRYVKLGLPHERAGRDIRVVVREADAWLRGGGVKKAIERVATTEARKVG